MTQNDIIESQPVPVALKEKGRARNGAEWQEPSELVSTRNELQSTRSAEVPVEPEFISIMRGITRNGGGDSIRYIDKLKSYALKWREEADKQFQYAGRLLEQLNKAESELTALRGRLMEPDEEMRKFARTLLSMSTVKTDADAVMLFKAMSAVALKQGK
jgi:hypothetical protein